MSSAASTMGTRELDLRGILIWNEVRECEELFRDRGVGFCAIRSFTHAATMAEVAAKLTTQSAQQNASFSSKARRPRRAVFYGTYWLTNSRCAKPSRALSLLSLKHYFAPRQELLTARSRKPRRDPRGRCDSGRFQLWLSIDQRQSGSSLFSLRPRTVFRRHLRPGGKLVQHVSLDHCAHLQHGAGQGGTVAPKLRRLAPARVEGKIVVRS